MTREEMRDEVTKIREALHRKDYFLLSQLIEALYKRLTENPADIRSLY